MEQDWLIVERLENWEADQMNGFSFFGLRPRYKSAASLIEKGDKVHCYVSGLSAFSDIRVVSEAGIRPIKEDSVEDIYDRPFAYCFATAPFLVLPTDKWIPLRQLASKLELTRGRSAFSCRAIFQTSIRRLSKADAATIYKAMQRASAKTKQPA